MARPAHYSTSILIMVAALMVVPVPAAPAGPVTALGQIATAGARLDGVAVPSGTTLLSPSLVETGATPAILHLRNGQVLALAAESAARLEGLASGAVRVVVKAGRISMVEPSGGAMTLAENSIVALSAEGPQVEATGAEEEEVRLCELVESTPAKFQLCTIDDPDAEECDWELLKVPENEVPNYLGISTVYAGTDKNDLGLDKDCEERPVGMIWPVKAGIVAGSVLGAVVFFQEVIEVQEEEPVSPSTP